MFADLERLETSLVENHIFCNQESEGTIIYFECQVVEWLQ